MADNERVEFHQQVTVGQDGLIEMKIPDVFERNVAEVTIHLRPRNSSPRSGYGSRRGQIRVPDDFKAPLAEFEPYS